MPVPTRLASALAALSFASLAFAPGRSAAADATARARSPVPILMWHHIAPARRATQRRSGLWVSPARFRRQVAALARAGFEAVTLDDLWAAWHVGGPLPPRAVVLTFDDGYADQGRNAAPVLQRFGWPAVLYLGPLTVDTRSKLRDADVLRLISAGWEVGAHSLTHPDLTRVGRARLRREVAGSRRRLQQRFGVPVHSFCYPYGRSDRRVRAAVRRAGYLSATTIRPGSADPGDDRLAWPRLKVTERTSPRSLLRTIRRLTRNAQS